MTSLAARSPSALRSLSIFLDLSAASFSPVVLTAQPIFAGDSFYPVKKEWTPCTALFETINRAAVYDTCCTDVWEPPARGCARIHTLIEYTVLHTCVYILRQYRYYRILHVYMRSISRDHLLLPVRNDAMDLNSTNLQYRQSLHIQSIYSIPWCTIHKQDLWKSFDYDQQPIHVKIANTFRPMKTLKRYLWIISAI